MEQKEGFPHEYVDGVGKSDENRLQQKFKNKSI